VVSTNKDALSAALVPRSFDEMRETAICIGGSGLWPGIKNEAQAVAVVALGAALGFSAPQALQLFHIVEGRPSLSAAGQAAVMHASPEIEYVHQIETTPERCILEGKRRGAPGPARASYTIEEAIKAGRCSRNPKGVIVAPGRSGKPGAWETATEDMLYARALSRLARRIAPDLLMGIYVPDEMEQIAEDDAPRVETRPAARPRSEVAAATVARRTEALRHGTSAPPAAVEDAEVVEADGHAEARAVLARAGLRESQFDAWALANKRAGLGAMPSAKAATVAKWLAGEGAAVVRQHAEAVEAAAAARGPDSPNPGALQAALEDNGIPAELADAWARHKGIKPAAEPGCRALWLSIMHPVDDEFDAFRAEWDRAHPEAAGLLSPGAGESPNW
jgi:hypothetical protein